MKPIGPKWLREAAYSLLDNMPWGETAEGFAFWESVYDRLVQIAADGVLDDAPTSA